MLASFDAATQLELVHSEDVLLSPPQTARTSLQPQPPLLVLLQLLLLPVLLPVLPLLVLPLLVSQPVPTSRTVLVLLPMVLMALVLPVL
ncbi:hypothetical protein P5F04_15840 [Clostridium perfringens]|nr:hypothetical protein [Clostridium perfringens]